MFKNKKNTIISVLVIVLLVTIPAFLFFKNRKEDVKDLYFRIETKNFVKNMDDLWRNKLANDKKYKPFKENPSQVRYELSAKLSSPNSIKEAFGDIPEPVIDIVNSSKLVLNSKYDLKEEKSLTSLAFLLEGLSFVDINMFTEKETIGLQVPIIYEKYFLFNRNNMAPNLEKFGLNLPIKKIVLPKEIKNASSFSILEIKDILVECIDALKSNISDEQIELGKTLESFNVGGKEGAKYDQFTLKFSQDEFKALYSDLIEIVFKDERLLEITTDNIIAILESIEEAGYFSVFPDFKPFVEKVLSYSNYNMLKVDLLSLIEKSQFPDSFTMKVVSDSSGNILARDIDMSQKDYDESARTMQVSFRKGFVSGKIEQDAENIDDNAKIEFNFTRKSLDDIQGTVKCINNIWPDFEANIKASSDSSENLKKKSINTNYKLFLELTVEEHGINDANILIDIKKEDRHNEIFEIPKTDDSFVINLTTVKEKELSDAIKDIQFSAAKFLLNNQDLIGPFIRRD